MGLTATEDGSKAEKRLAKSVNTMKTRTINDVNRPVASSWPPLDSQQTRDLGKGGKIRGIRPNIYTAYSYAELRLQRRKNWSKMAEGEQQAVEGVWQAVAGEE